VTAVPFLIGTWLSVRGAWQARGGEHGVLPLALLCSLFLANMSGDWVASKLLWFVLAYAFVSGRWQAVHGWPVPVQSRRWVMAMPSRVKG
jgi:hypothetical protein